MTGLNLLTVTFTLLLSYIISATKLTYISNSYFQKESCLVPLHENVTWYSHNFNVFLTPGHLFRIEHCQIMARKALPSSSVQVLGQAPSQEIFLCLSDELYQIDNSLSDLVPVAQSSNYYNLGRLCTSTKLTTTWIQSNLYTISQHRGTATLSKFLPDSGDFVESSGMESSDEEGMRPFIFNHGIFVYTVYRGSSGEARIVRTCQNDEGSFGSFSSDRHGKLSCSILQVDHTMILDAQFSSSHLYLLTSRDPVELSGRVLCAIRIEDLDSSLNTGRYLNYDEMGVEIGTPGREQNCDHTDQPNYLTQHLDLIQGSRVVLSHHKSYSRFRTRDGVWYLNTDSDELDIWREKHDRTLTRTQTVQTNLSSVKILLSDSDNNVTLVSKHKITAIPKYFCGHIQGPVECYNGPSCSFDTSTWTCSLAEEKRTFAEDYPEGVERREISEGGCVTDITVYTEHNTRSTQQRVTCPAPTLSRNVEILTTDTTCLGHVTMRCVEGSDLTHGDLIRQCLPSGEWSGTQPVCTERLCPTFSPSPGSYISTDSTTVGTQVQVTCVDSCHVTSHDETLICGENGQWNGTLPTCAPATCHPLPLPKNTELVYDESRPKCGSQFAVRCVTGTDRVYGDLTRTCTKDGSWTGQVPLCTVTQCPVIKTPKNGYLSTTSRQVGALVTASCDACHKISGAPGLTLAVSTQCLSSGRWSIDPPSCEAVSCPLLYPSTGVNMMSLNTTCIGSAEFQCSTGYKLYSGSTIRYCQPDGKWSGAPPLCVLESCPALQFSSQDHVIITRRGERYGEKSLLDCEPGYTLFSGSLELHCLAGGLWSGELPRCAPTYNQNSLDFRSEAPAEVSRRDTPNSPTLRVVAITGWVLFSVLLLFVLIVVVLVRRGGWENLCAGHNKGKAGLERQVTACTTLGVGTLDLRKSRLVDSEGNAITPTFIGNGGLVTPVTPTYHLGDMGTVSNGVT